MTLQRLMDTLVEKVMRLCAFVVPLQRLPGFTTGAAVLLGICSILLLKDTRHAIAH